VLIDQKLILHRYSSACYCGCYCCCCCSWGDALQTKPKTRSFQIGLAKIWPHCSIRVNWRSRIFDVTSYFQDGAHDIRWRPPLAY